ncbi:MAG: cytochrome c [Acidobacteriota bacterium]|jgi:cytochrome c2|nr:cytochrome c [Acidobacteriota bacterium]
MRWVTGTVIGVLLLAGGAVIWSQSGGVDHGKEVYATQKCSLCHSTDGSGKKSLVGVGTRLKPDDIRKWIKSPKEMKSDTAMKSYPNLPGKDLDDLVAYLATLK